MDTLGTEATGWVCILGAAPLALAGFVTYNGMPLEKFLCCLLYTSARTQTDNTVRTAVRDEPYFDL